METRSPSVEEKSMSRQKGTSQRSGSWRNTECLLGEWLSGFPPITPSLLPPRARTPLALPAPLVCSLLPTSPPSYLHERITGRQKRARPETVQCSGLGQAGLWLGVSDSPQLCPPAGDTFPLGVEGGCSTPGPRIQRNSNHRSLGYLP